MSDRGEQGRPLGTEPSLVTRGSAVKSRSIRWLWEGRLALGYLTVQTGTEGLGKSVFDAWMIAGLTRGELPGQRKGRPVDVLIVAGEDGIADTWKPRLDLAGADPERWATLNLDALDDGWNVRDGIEQIEAALDETGATLLFIDSALDHFPAGRGGAGINDPTFVRQALGPLRRLVREREIVGLFSMHPPKARSGDFRDLVQASQAFGALPRVGLLFAYHPDDDDEDEADRRRVLIRGKGNIGRNPGALEFRVVGRDYTHDDGHTTEVAVAESVNPSAVTIADLAPSKMLGERKVTKAEQAADLMREILADHEWHEATPIRTALARAGLDSGSVRMHGIGLAGVETRKRPGETDGPHEWRIPKSPNRTDSSPSRAMSLSANGLFDESGLNGSSGGKSPRVHDQSPNRAGKGEESKSPLAGGTTRASNGASGDLDGELHLRLIDTESVLLDELHEHDHTGASTENGQGG